MARDRCFNYRDLKDLHLSLARAYAERGDEAMAAVYRDKAKQAWKLKPHPREFSERVDFTK